MKPLPIEQWEGMRVLTVREPWATLIVRGWKDVENRARRFNHRGPILIHASATLTRGYHDCAIRWILGNVSENARPATLPTFEQSYKNRGLIVGGCELSDCAKYGWSGRQFFEKLPFGKSTWKDGSDFALHMINAWVAVDPMPFKGQLGLATFRRITP